jgi:hypothetical protein
MDSCWLRVKLKGDKIEIKNRQKETKFFLFIAPPFIILGTDTNFIILAKKYVSVPIFKPYAQRAVLSF